MQEISSEIRGDDRDRIARKSTAESLISQGDFLIHNRIPIMNYPQYRGMRKLVQNGMSFNEFATFFP